MKWDEIPKGTSFAMSQEGVDQLRAGRPRAFGYGVICGVVLTISLQSCLSEESKTDDAPKPKSSSSATHKPGN
ncbi:hypothetical protein phiRKBJ001_75 [Streptomyces phage phiRKBJ001]|nr:hypothetical protein phiRKBJ001_75 [Streptomyces phage phiRKBJ001]